MCWTEVRCTSLHSRLQHAADLAQSQPQLYHRDIVCDDALCHILLKTINNLESLMAPSIAPVVRECMGAFKRVISNRTDVPVEALEEEFGRFRIWAGNVSAHTTGRRSLEYRLRDSSELATAVLGYVRSLLATLAEGQSACD